MPKHNTFLFKNVHTLAIEFDVTSSATTSPGLGNNMFQVHQNTSCELSIASELQGTKYRYCMRN